MIGKRRNIIKSVIDLLNPYAWVTGARNLAFDKGLLDTYSPEIPTICIGNLTVGGTGKTPHTEYLVRLLKERYRIAVLSRGYGRRSKGYILANELSRMEDIGDEPFQINKKFTGIDVAVCEKRVEGIKRLLTESSRPNVILLDDAYQHRYVKAGLNILLIDSGRPVWLDCTMPFGRLRERISGMSRADIIIITKCNGMTPGHMEEYRQYLKTKSKAPVFFSKMRYGNIYNVFDRRVSVPTIGCGTEILLVTGIAKPEPLKKELEKRGAAVTMMRYADHHNFSHGDIEDIAAGIAMLKSTSRLIITTEKDATRLLLRTDIPETVRRSTYALPIEVEFLDNGKEMFNQIIENYVTEDSRNG